MQLIEQLAYMFPKHKRLSKNEAKILDTLIKIKSDNAYGLWKTSGLKHYPTVLRTLKKLEERRFVQVLSENGIRGERIYAPTLFGTLLHYTERKEESQLIDIISVNSRLFQEMLKSKVIEDMRSWVYTIVRHMVYDMIEGKMRNIDDVVKEIVLDTIQDNVLDIQKQTAKNEIIKLSKVESVRKLAIEVVESRIAEWKKEAQELKKLRETLTTS